MTLQAIGLGALVGVLLIVLLELPDLIRRMRR